jgi:hypothetical protein
MRIHSASRLRAWSHGRRHIASPNCAQASLCRPLRLRRKASTHQHRAGHSAARAILLVKIMSRGCVSRVNRWMQWGCSCTHSLTIISSAWLHHIRSCSCCNSLSLHNVGGRLWTGESNPKTACPMRVPSCCSKNAACVLQTLQTPPRTLVA